MALRTAPSVLFDAVVVLSGPEGDKKLSIDPNAISFLTDAKRHCKAVGFAGIPSLAKRAGIVEEPGIAEITSKSRVKGFMAAARTGRFWDREAE